jgi:hypothetical protein
LKKQRLEQQLKQNEGSNGRGRIRTTIKTNAEIEMGAGVGEL